MASKKEQQAPDAVAAAPTPPPADLPSTPPVEPPKKEGKTVTAHALATGHAKQVQLTVHFGGDVPKEAQLRFSAEHAAAAQLHGWAAHKMATSKEFKCEREDYLKALEAVSASEICRQRPEPPPKHRRLGLGYPKPKRRERKRQQASKPTYAPHPGALSKYAAVARQKSEVA